MEVKKPINKVRRCSECNMPLSKHESGSRCDYCKSWDNNTKKEGNNG